MCESYCYGPAETISATQTIWTSVTREDEKGGSIASSTTPSTLLFRQNFFSGEEVYADDKLTRLERLQLQIELRGKLQGESEFSVSVSVSDKIIMNLV